MQKTPLFDLHTKLHGKMEDYYGYALPSSYEAGETVEKERATVSCGIFDACFFGELELAGESPKETLEKIFEKSFDMNIGEIKRVTLFSENVDVYRVAEKVYMIIISPKTHEKAVGHIRENLVGKTTLLDISNALGAVLLKGARAEMILKNAITLPSKEDTFATVNIKEVSCIVSRVADGFLFVCNFQKIKSVYEEIALVGIPQGLLPCGFKAM